MAAHWAAIDTETADSGEEYDAIRQEQLRTALVRLGRATIVCSGALAVFALVTVARLRFQDESLPERMLPGLSLEDLEDPAIVLPLGFRTGCENWETALMKVDTFENASGCLYACVATPGCIEFGYQPYSCALPGMGTTQRGTCYLYSESCVEVVNTCWDQYRLTKPSLPEWCLVQSKRGCANWMEVRLEVEKVALSASACGLQCLSNEDCTNFNFQPQSCPETATACSEKYSCMLMSCGCEPVDSPYWDFYQRGACPSETTLKSGASANLSKGDPTADASTGDLTADASTSDPTANAPTSDPTANASSSDPRADASTSIPTADAWTTT